MWGSNQKEVMPVTWNNYYSSKEERMVDDYYLNQGFDVMYDKITREPYFIHGPDPSVKPKDNNVLNTAYNDYKCTKLMVVAHPDDELIFALLVKNLSDRQILIEKKFIDYIVKRIDRSYGKIFDFIYKIDKISLNKKKPIDFNIINEVLGE